VSAQPSNPEGPEATPGLPAGALPPPIRPRLTRQQWWYVNKWVILVPVIIVVLLAGLWVAQTVPIVTYHDSVGNKVVPALMQGTITDYQAWYSLTSIYRATAAGTYWAPAGDLVEFAATGTSTYYSNNTSSGSFHVNLGGPPGDGLLLFIALTGATIYLNYTVTYVGPLIQSSS